MVRDCPTQNGPPPREQPAEKPYPAEKARGGEIILRTPAQRGIFIAGLAGAIVLMLVLALTAIATR